MKKTLIKTKKASKSVMLYKEGNGSGLCCW